METWLNLPLVDRAGVPSLPLPLPLHLPPVRPPGVLLDGDVGPVVRSVGPGEAGPDVREVATCIERVDEVLTSYRS